MLLLNRMSYPILKAGSASDVTKKNQGRVEYGNILGQEMAVAAGILPRVTLQKGGGGSSSSRTASLVGATLVTSAERTTAVTTLISNVSINPRTAAVLSAAALSKYGIQSVPGAVAAAVAVADPTAPGAPTSLVATPSNLALSIAFSLDNGGSAITNFSYSTDGTTYTPFSPAQTSSPVTITGLTNGTPYTYYLKAINAIGTGVASSSITATPSTVPGAPTMGTPTAGNNSVSLTFTAPGSNGGSAITNYSYSTDGTNYTAFSPAQTTSPLTISGLTNGNSYTLYIKAINAAGSSTASAASSSIALPLTLISSGMTTIRGIVADSTGNIFVSDIGANKIWKVASDGTLSLFAGSGTAASTDGTGAGASFTQLRMIAIDSSNNLYVAQYLSNPVRKITTGGVVSTISNVSFSFGVAVDNNNNYIYSSEYPSATKIWRNSTSGGTPTQIISVAGSTYAGIVCNSAGNIFACDNAGSTIRLINVGAQTASLFASVLGPWAITIDPSSNLYVSSSTTTIIYKITSGGTVTTYYTASATSAGLAWYNNKLYIGIGTTIIIV